MQDLSLHILDIVENSVTASATVIEIRVVEDSANDRLLLEITDDGAGMDEQMRQQALDPFFSTRTTRRIGLGLPLLVQATQEASGGLELVSAPGRGTSVKAEFRLNHPDRKPLGDIPATLAAILAGNPELQLVFEYRKDSELVASLDTREPTENRTE